MEFLETGKRREGVAVDLTVRESLLISPPPFKGRTRPQLCSASCGRTLNSSETLLRRFNQLSLPDSCQPALSELYSIY